MKEELTRHLFIDSIFTGIKRWFCTMLLALSRCLNHASIESTSELMNLCYSVIFNPFNVPGKFRPIHIIIRSIESEFDRHETRPIRNQRTKMNLVSPYPSRAEFHGNYKSRTTLYENQGKDNRKSGNKGYDIEIWFEFQ